jgi:hypothetical protein
MPDEPPRADAETLALIDLALRVAAEAAEVCGWFSPDFKKLAALRAAEAAFGEAYGIWYDGPDDPPNGGGL